MEDGEGDGQDIPTENGADEAHDTDELSTHPKTITVDDLLSNLAHKVKVVIVDPAVRVVRSPSSPPVDIEVERGYARGGGRRGGRHGCLAACGGQVRVQAGAGRCRCG